MITAFLNDPSVFIAFPSCIFNFISWYSDLLHKSKNSESTRDINKR